MRKLKPKTRKGEDPKQKVDTQYSKIFKPYQIHRLHPNPRIDNIQAFVRVWVLCGVKLSKLY